MVTSAPQATSVPTASHRSFVGSGGVRLHADVYGPEQGPALLLTHGFGQTRLAWEQQAVELAMRGYLVTALDARGHGDSEWSSGYLLDDFLADVEAVCAAIGRPLTLIGASMGGLVGLLLAGERPQVPVNALVMVDVTPRWETRGVERIIAFMRARPEGFADVSEAIDLIGQYLPLRAKRHDAGSLSRYLRQTVDGRLRWHWDPRLLDSIEASAAPYLNRLNRAAEVVTKPLLLVSGAQSDVVSQAGIDEFLGRVPHAQHRRIDGAGHMVVGDRHEHFAQAIKDFLTGLEPVSPV